MNLRSIAMGLALAACATQAHAAQILGLNSSQAGAGSGSTPYGLYILDTTSGESTFLGLPENSTPRSDYGNPNGLAYSSNGVAYFAALVSSNSSRLFSYNLLTQTTTDLGALTGSVASGAYHDGSYYYINGSGTLYKANVAGPFSQAPVAVTGSVPTGYGDIAIASNGILYGSGTSGAFFSIDLATGIRTNLGINRTGPSGSGRMLQLGFGTDGLLYGVETATDLIFSIDLTNGALTQTATLQTGGLQINDAASFVAPVPEPSTLTMAGAGAVAGLGAWWRRRRRAGV